MLAAISKSITEIAKKQDLECKLNLPTASKNPTENLQDLFKTFHSIISAIECINQNIENKDPTELKPYAKHLSIIHDPANLQNLSVEMTHSLNFSTLVDQVKPEDVDGLYGKYKNATYLYVQIMQGLIRELFKKDIKLMAKAIELVETRKTEVLAASYKLKAEIKRPSNPMLSRFNLVPATGMMSVNEILERVAVDLQIKTGAKNFRDLVKGSDCGVIIIYKLISDPIEIRSHQLLFPNQPTEQVPTTPNESHPGISKAMVQKYNTIVELTPPKKSKGWDFSGEVIDKKETKRYLVVETLDQIQYRILAPWINAKTGGVLLGKFRVERLIRALQAEKIEPTRPSVYNRAVSYATAKNMFLKRPVDLDTYGKFSDLPSHRLFQEVSQKILIQMSKNWGRTKKLGKFELNDIFHDQEYAEILKKSVMTNYRDVCTNDVINAPKNIFGEIFTSFLVEMERSAVKLMKELHDAYLKLPAEVDKQECEDLIVKILTMIVKPHDNIYAALEYKNHLFLMLSLTNIKKVKAKEQAKEFFDL